MERTLIIIKPDGVQRGLMGEIVGRLERRGLRLAGMKFMQMSKELAATHYAVHKDRPFYDSLIDYIISGPVLVMVWEANNAIEVVRATIGATSPGEAAAGTIRGDLGLEIGRNLVHGSDGEKTAKVEVELFFGEDGLVEWGRSIDGWVFE